MVFYFDLYLRLFSMLVNINTSNTMIVSESIASTPFFVWWKSFFINLIRKTHDNGSKYSLILEEVRVELAIDCLKNTNYKLKDISQMLGFFTVNSFITWFKSVKGVTPRKFREQNNFN